MATKIGDGIRLLLFKPHFVSEDATTDERHKLRVRRKYVPRLLVKLWEIVEGKSLHVRTVEVTQPKPPTFTRSVSQDDNTKVNADHNKALIKDYFGLGRQLDYLKTLSEWRGIDPNDRDSKELTKELQERTGYVAMWLASHDTHRPGENIALNDLKGNWLSFSRVELTPALLHEATNIALRSMLDAERYRYKQDYRENTLSPDTVQTRIYPAEDLQYPINSSDLGAKDNYEAHFFPFDLADHEERESFLRQWSALLNHKDSSIDHYI